MIPHGLAMGLFIRSLLRMARDEWQWIETITKIRFLAGEMERIHLAALIRFALATGCRAREITGLEWNRVDLQRKTTWLNQTKNGTPRGVPLNYDAIVVLEEQLGKHEQFCFTYQGKPILLGNYKQCMACRSS